MGDGMDFSQITSHPNIIYVTAGTALVLILTIVVAVWLLSSGKKRRAVAFVGLCGSGKTLLHYQLLHDDYKKTYTSMKENIGSLSIGRDGGKALLLIDVPGHERVRSTVLDKYITLLRGLVVVVDSVYFPKESIDTAGLLYDLFSNRTLMASKLPVLIACNKQDISLAQDVATIEEELAQEINTLRKSRGAALEGISGAREGQQVFVGKKNKDFAFTDLPCRVTFVACSARGSQAEGSTSEADIQNVKDWIAQLA